MELSNESVVPSPPRASYSEPSDPSNYLVAKSNDLVHARYNLSLDEQRLLLYVLAIVDSQKECPNLIRITAQEYGKAYGIDLKNAYRQLKEASDNFYDASIQFADETTGENGKMRWVNSIRYHNKEGYVSLEFSEHIRPYLFQLTGAYTSFRFKQVRHLKSSYAVRILDLVMQWPDRMNSGIRVAVSDLRTILECEKKYSEFRDFRRRIIQPAIEDLNKSQEVDRYHFDFTLEKRGKTITHVVFYAAPAEYRSIA